MMSISSFENQDIIRWLITILAPPISGLLGVLLGSWLSVRKDRIQRQHDFIEKQLLNFYSPLLSIYKEIKIRSEVRKKISVAANAVWQKLCQEREGNPEALHNLSEERTDFKRIIEYNNKQLKNKNIPSYREMVNIFKDNWQFASLNTRPYYDLLFEFVDIWERFLDDSLPPEIIDYLNHTEEKLKPFYENLHINHDKLRSRLERGE